MGREGIYSPLQRPAREDVDAPNNGGFPSNAVIVKVAIVEVVPVVFM